MYQVVRLEVNERASLSELLAELDQHCGALRVLVESGVIWRVV
jgi:hypothetical protein